MPGSRRTSASRLENWIQRLSVTVLAPSVGRLDCRSAGGMCTRHADAPCVELQRRSVAKRAAIGALRPMCCAETHDGGERAPRLGVAARGVRVVSCAARVRVAARVRGRHGGPTRPALRARLFFLVPGDPTKNTYATTLCRETRRTERFNRGHQGVCASCRSSLKWLLHDAKALAVSPSDAFRGQRPRSSQSKPCSPK